MTYQDRFGTPRTASRVRGSGRRRQAGARLMIDGDSTYEDGLGDIHSCRLGDLRLGLTRMRVTFVSLVSEGVCDACCLRVYVCVGGYVLGYELVICICIQDNINIVHNQFGSANQRYCALPHHSSTFGLTLRCLTKEVVHSI